MYGAILGDIVGSSYEFDYNNYKGKDFPLFSQRSEFTDDTVMTLAVTRALLDTRGQDDITIKAALVREMQRLGRAYPDKGYGARFNQWLYEDDPQPYRSYGNGSAMRVSPAAWLAESIQEALHLAKLTADVTHDHPEGIKGAQAVAAAIFLARTGHSKVVIKAYVECKFGYDLSRTCDEIRPTYHHVESCQQTVPEAIIAFLEAESFEDAVRNAVSLGGDTDTLAAITGSIAEAYFGIPAVLKAECRKRIDPEMNRVLDAFDEALGRTCRNLDERMQGNALIENAIINLYEKQDNDSFIDVVTSICFRIKQDGSGMVPFVTVGEGMFSDLDVYSLKEGDTVTLDHEVRIRMDTVAAGDGEEWFYIFTNEDEIHKQPIPEVVMEIPFADMFDIAGRSDKVAGVVINPFGKYFKADKKVIECIFEVCKNMED